MTVLTIGSNQSFFLTIFSTNI